MNVAQVVPLLLQSVSVSDSFTDGARKIASFIKKTEERFEAPEVIGALFSDTIAPKIREYLLFSFLDICRADFDVLEHAIVLRQLRRLMVRARSFPACLSDQEKIIVATLRDRLRIANVNDIVAASRSAASLVRQISEQGFLREDAYIYLATLLTSEALVLKTRNEWLSDHVDAYNMKAIARLLPLLTLCDEYSCNLREIANRILQGEPLGRAILTFEYALHSDAFEKWIKKVRSESAFNQFIDCIQVQRNRRIPLRSLVAVATISRRIHAADAPPLTWISHALNCCTSDGFRIDIGSHASLLRNLLSLCNITPAGPIITGSFTTNSFLQWVGIDMLTREPAEGEKEPSPKELIMRCMSNDALLMRLIENPKVLGTPGLVALVAATCRSLAVLQKIAITKELHTGHANNAVPLALLRNPTHIPFSQIRQFINTRYVSFMEMKELLRNPFGIRREIYMEIKAYVDQRYK